MKKKAIYMVLLLVILMGMTGCSSSGSGENKADEAEILSEKDFNIEYESLTINEKVDVSEITDEIGFGEGHEDNNFGYVSTIDEGRVWGLYYPGRDDPELRLVYIDDMEKNNLMTVYLFKIPTSRGLKVGDAYEKMVELYGEPQIKDKDNIYGDNIYEYGDKKMIIQTDGDGRMITGIALCYMEID